MAQSLSLPSPNPNSNEEAFLHAIAKSGQLTQAWVHNIAELTVISKEQTAKVEKAVQKTTDGKPSLKTLDAAIRKGGITAQQTQEEIAEANKKQEERDKKAYLQNAKSTEVLKIGIVDSLSNFSAKIAQGISGTWKAITNDTSSGFGQVSKGLSELTDGLGEMGPAVSMLKTSIKKIRAVWDIGAGLFRGVFDVGMGVFNASRNFLNWIIPGGGKGISPSSFGGGQEKEKGPEEVEVAGMEDGKINPVPLPVKIMGHGEEFEYELGKASDEEMEHHLAAEAQRDKDDNKIIELLEEQKKGWFGGLGSILNALLPLAMLGLLLGLLTFAVRNGFTAVPGRVIADLINRGVIKPIVDQGDPFSKGKLEESLKRKGRTSSSSWWSQTKGPAVGTTQAAILDDAIPKTVTEVIGGDPVDLGEGGKPKIVIDMFDGQHIPWDVDGVDIPEDYGNMTPIEQAAAREAALRRQAVSRMSLSQQMKYWAFQSPKATAFWQGAGHVVNAGGWALALWEASTYWDDAVTEQERLDHIFNQKIPIYKYDPESDSWSSEPSPITKEEYDNLTNAINAGWVGDTTGIAGGVATAWATYKAANAAAIATGGWNVNPWGQAAIIVTSIGAGLTGQMVIDQQASSAYRWLTTGQFDNPDNPNRGLQFWDPFWDKAGGVDMVEESIMFTLDSRVKELIAQNEVYSSALAELSADDRAMVVRGLSSQIVNQNLEQTEVNMQWLDETFKDIMNTEVDLSAVE